jgi:hypothetical protein
VSGSIADKYYSLGGSKGSLGNPAAAEEALAGGGRLQRFEHGAILAPPQGVFALHGLLWEKFEAEGGMAEMGVPRSDSYSYFVGPAVEWRADFADASIVWTEGSVVPAFSRRRMRCAPNTLPTPTWLARQYTHVSRKNYSLTGGAERRGHGSSQTASRDSLHRHDLGQRTWLVVQLCGGRRRWGPNLHRRR